MAYAKKCDRCGKYYDYKPPKFEELNKKEIYKKINESFDFCDDCLEDFKVFMKEGAKNDN